MTKSLPFSAGEALYGGARAADTRPPWTAFGVLCATPLVAVAAAAYRLRRSDA